MNCNEFLKIAQTDLDASKVLLNGGLYSQALFSFQQAVEKTTKYMGLEMGAIKSDQLQRSIGHDVVKVFTKMFSSLPSLFAAVHNELGTENANDKLYDNAFHIINDCKNMMKAENNKVAFVVDNINQIHQEPMTIPENPNLCAFDRLNSHLNKLGVDLLPEIANEVLKSHLNSRAENTILQINESDKILMITILLCLLFVDYDVNKLRYPDICNEYSPRNEFPQESDYVQSLPYFQETLQQIINKVPRVLIPAK